MPERASSSVAHIAHRRTHHRRRALAVALAAVLSAFLPRIAVRAQGAAEQVALGDRESAARHTASALEHYERALQQDPSAFVALWKASREAVDLGEVEPIAATRTALYARATDYARRAVALNPNDADAHFHLARALGRTALSLGARERVKYAQEIRAQALRALELQPRHPGALHVMGAWNAEIMRLGGIQRLFAKTFLGGSLFDTASWAEATRYLELAVSVEPDRLVHRLDLARVYRDRALPGEARAAYVAAIRLPSSDANDDVYRRAAERELASLKP